MLSKFARNRLLDCQRTLLVNSHNEQFTVYINGPIPATVAHDRNLKFDGNNVS